MPTQALDGDAYLFVRPDRVPEVWQERAVPMLMVPLLPEEAADVLDGRAAGSLIDPGDESLARLVARGLPARAIAHELGVSLRTVYRGLADLREHFGAVSREELVSQLAERGFGR